MSANREWQAVEYEIVSKMANGGRTDAEIGATLMRGSDEVFKARKRMGIESSNLGDLWGSDAIDRLRAMYEGGRSDEEIAAVLERSPTSVKNKRKRLGLVREAVPVRETKRGRVLGNLSRMTNDEKRAYLRSLSPLRANERNDKFIEHCHAGFILAMFEADHRPGQGEFSIPAEGRVVRPSDLVCA